jgi:hypothetical protein
MRRRMRRRWVWWRRMKWKKSKGLEVSTMNDSRM